MEDEGYIPAGRDSRAESSHTSLISGDGVLLSTILSAVRRSGTTSRSDLVRDTGLGKALVAQYAEILVQRNIVVDEGVGASRGGRRPRMLRFAPERGLIGAVDLGASSVDVAITDLGSRVLARRSENADVGEGPHAVLQNVVTILNDILSENNFSPANLWGIGMGVPGPVEFGTGTPVSPPIMPGWDGFSVRRYLQGHFSCPVYVDNDVNVHALGEAAMGVSVGVSNSVFVKIGTGIGSGLIVQGKLYRGSQGCAGDIGHIQVDSPDAGHVTCRCGNVNCLEALAGGEALGRDAEEAARSGKSARLAERLAQQGFLSAEDVGEMAEKGDAWSTEKIRQSGRIIGYTLAGLVNFLNPSLIVIGGGVANLGDSFLAAIREMVYRRSLPLATRLLRIERSSLGSQAGVIGASHVVLDELFSAERVIDVLNVHYTAVPAVGG